MPTKCTTKQPHGAIAMRITEAAALIGCSRRFLEKQISAGRLTACKPSPRVTLIRSADLDAYLSRSATA
jgi:excisionase family DNA binding protein